MRAQAGKGAGVGRGGLAGVENRQRYTRQKVLRRRTDDSDCKVQALWDTLLITFTSIFLSMTEDEELQ